MEFLSESEKEAFAEGGKEEWLLWWTDAKHVTHAQIDTLKARFSGPFSYVHEYNVERATRAI
jgi:hypothetical protein